MTRYDGVGYANGGKNLRVSDEMHARLVRAARERHVSLRWLTDQAIREFCDRLIPVEEIKMTRPATGPDETPDAPVIINAPPRSVAVISGTPRGGPEQAAARLSELERQAARDRAGG